MHLVDNRNAATLVVIAAALFAAAFIGPFMSVAQPTGTRTFSLLGGIAALVKDGKITLGVVLFTFSVVFPLAKLGLILASTSRLVAASARARRWMHAVAERTARFSLVDVVVIALLIIVFKVEGLAEVQARWGTFCFLAAALTSMVAGLVVDVHAMENHP
jgi:paraquat-inducible protein A